MTAAHALIDAPDALIDAPADALPVTSAEPSRPRLYKRVDVEAELAPQAFSGLDKVGGLYSVRLNEPLLVQTPPLTLVSPLDDEEGAPLPHAHLSLPEGFADFGARVEQAVLEACLTNKADWFRRTMEDDALRASFKQFCKAGCLRVRLPRDALFFDAEGRLLAREAVHTGATVRCLLELAKISFGRTEFGAMWSLVQAQTPPAPPPPPRCLIDPAADATDPEPEADEFL